MRDISANHSIERHTAALVVEPIIVEFARVDRTDDVADVPVVEFQQHHQSGPILMLVVLESNPQVIILSIVGKYEHTHLCVWHRMTAAWGILQAHYALMIVRSGVDEVPHKHLYRAVLMISFHTHLLFRKR